MNKQSIRFYLTYIFLIFIVFTILNVNNAMANQVQEWRFKVYLDDKWIGYHNFRLTPQESNRHTLDSTASFDVKFLFFNAYSYRHNNTEQWQQKCLKSIQANTDDNGKRSTVQGSTEGGRFYLVNGSSRTTLSDCVMSFAYWDTAILKADRLLNSQTGEYVDVDVLSLGNEQIPVNGESVIANRYRLITDEAEIDLWYAVDSNRWLALQSTTEGGRKISYLME